MESFRKEERDNRFIITLSPRNNTLSQPIFLNSIHPSLYMSGSVLTFTLFVLHGCLIVQSKTEKSANV